MLDGVCLVILTNAHLVWCLLEYIMVQAASMWSLDFNSSSLRKNEPITVDKIFHYNLCIFIKTNQDLLKEQQRKPGMMSRVRGSGEGFLGYLLSLRLTRDIEEPVAEGRTKKSVPQPSHQQTLNACCLSVSKLSVLLKGFISYWLI